MAQKQPFFPDLPLDLIPIVEGTERMRQEPGESCKKLLAAARAALAQAQAANDIASMRVTAIGIASAYRNFARDSKAWYEAFATHYDNTQALRDAATGGPHGSAACGLLVDLLSGLKAPPGFSNHTNGTAVDLSTTDGGVELTANSSQHKQWLRSWLHVWLVANAVQFRFYPLVKPNPKKSEEWHWDYR